MELVFEDDYLVFKQDIETHTFLYYWKPASGELIEEEVLKLSYGILDAVLGSGCKNIIEDCTDFTFAPSPKMQDEINEQMLLKLNGAIQKFAHVVSKDIFTLVSIEQLYEKNKSKTYEDKFFDSVDEALRWISGK